MGSGTPEQRSYNMSRIRGKDTDIELMLRRELWSRGLRYRKNVKSVPGKPDIAFLGKRVAVFCDSEFWHGYDWENSKETIKARRDFWYPKIERNMERDREVNATLEAEGWVVIRFWGREIKSDVKGCADRVEATLSAR